MIRSAAHDTLRLLIVDDDDVDRETLRRMLAASPLNPEMVEAASGQAALKAVRSGHFDCVLLDYHLGDGIGTDFVTQINTQSGRACPIILITGMGNETVAVKAMREGVYDYLSKHHLDAEQLHNTIESTLRQVDLERELKDSQERLKWLGLYDSLTGLPNRNLFFDRLEQATHAAARGSSGFGLLMIDLDLFKEVNDTLGHDAGDQVLTEIGKRLRQVARVSDTYARLGGDEFAGILLGTHSIVGVCTVAKALGEVIKKPIEIGCTTVSVGASIGISVAPLHGVNGRQLLSQADMAMYSAKRGKRSYQIATGSALEAGVRNGVAIANEITEAIERNELFLHFQPKVSLCTGQLVGVEALARWDKPGVGIILPDKFIAAVERTSVIAPMTFAILDMALDQMRLWQDNGWRIPISINLSASMLEDETLAPRISAALAQRGLPRDLLMLEITEATLMQDPPKAKRALAELTATGVAISIDDFGSGYSSLLYLKELDIHEIKLDKAFVDGLGSHGRDESIVRSVAALSQGFAINLVAEGIEKRASLPLLKELGCTFGQGYSIARPMSADAFSRWWPSWQAADEKDFGG